MNLRGSIFFFAVFVTVLPAQTPARPTFDLEKARIEAVDRQGPALHSVIETNPDALTIADQLDAERRSRGPRGPLHGIPILIKDNIATADRMMTTAGSLALVGIKPTLADAIAEAAIADMKKQGAVIVDPANIPTLGKFDDSENDVLQFEFKADLNKYLAWLGPAAPVHSLKDVIAFNAAHKDQEMPYFGQELLEQSEKRGPLTSAKYRAALAKDRQMSRALGIDAVMARFRLDALVAPTGGPAWVIDLVNGDGGTATAPGPSTVTSVAGYPHITVPAGYFRGLPVGISFFGRAWSEPILIKLAYAYEQATKHRRRPTFAATAELPRR